jgi:predicted nucleotidyltransferase
MNVRGLSEAVESAETVLLPGNLTTRVPSIPVLALLKLLTWWDRRASTRRGAIDLATMIDWYSSGTYIDRLYDEEMDVLVRHDFDPAPAGAWLLGSHTPGLLDPAGVAAVLRIVEDDDALAQLANDTGVPAPRGQALVRAMGAGIRDTARVGVE